MFVFDEIFNSHENKSGECACGYHLFDVRVKANGCASLQCRCCRKVYGEVSGAVSRMAHEISSVINSENRRVKPV